MCGIRRLYRKQCNDVVIYNFGNFSLPSERVWISGGKRGKHGSGPPTGFSECFLFDPNFFGKDFWCAAYVDCAANNAIVFSFAILEIFLYRVNVFGFRGESVENTVAGHLRGFRSVFFMTPIFPEETLGVRNT